MANKYLFAASQSVRAKPTTKTAVADAFTDHLQAAATNRIELMQRQRPSYQSQIESLKSIDRKRSVFLCVCDVCCLLNTFRAFTIRNKNSSLHVQSKELVYSALL